MKHEPMEKYLTKICQQAYYVLLLLANNSLISITKVLLIITTFTYVFLLID